MRKYIKGSGREIFSIKFMASTAQHSVSCTFTKNNHFSLLKLKNKAHISLS